MPQNDGINNMGFFDPPVVSPPAPVKRLPLNTKPETLSKDVRARLPVHDADTFFISFPANDGNNITSKMVYDNNIKPVLIAIGFKEGIKNFRMPPPQGIPTARANLKTIAHSVEGEYLSNPQLRRPKTQKMIDLLAGRIQADDELVRTFAIQEGMSFQQYKADTERLQTLYPFLQTHQGILI
jgi:hypothetical protein